MASSSSATLDCQRLVDMRSDAVRLCITLQSPLNFAFLSAASELLSCARLPSVEFRMHSRKIIRLIETARDKLEASGIPLYLFTSCPKPRQCQYKAVYFDLLRMLHARRRDVDPALQARTKTLLIRLSSNFIGRSGAAASQVAPARLQLPENLKQTLAMGITTCTPYPPTFPAGNTMPSPDAFPPVRYRKRRRHAPFVVAPPRKRTRCGHDQENEIPAPVAYTYKAPPLTKRFGIFCTPKSSMHRPRSVRAC
ncbi:hypothetical protein B0H15DRAFT_493028 [Mycena belliarum]|uniref:Uncharacterized protein n=1 Tax=Mycena belliarum TaxID=1033014 RepID=A0AAD6XJZ9_9AGAR|nr:hypothetical protein B0H15DRAFT_493028 [Mycena belliae]